jgi:hypothetical protein
MPTLDEMTNAVFRELADESKTVFSTAQVQDFVRAGVAEISRIAPYDAVETIDLKANTFLYSTKLNHVYRVELRGPSGATIVVPVEDGENGWQTGWTFLKSTVEGRPIPPTGAGAEYTFQGGVIELPYSVSTVNPDLYSIRLYGYAPRINPLSGTWGLTLSFAEEMAVREYAKAEGFTLLTHDRALFAQWQGQTNNTDVSPTQMMNMAATAKQEWSRRRGRMRVVRRY